MVYRGKQLRISLLYLNMGNSQSGFEYISALVLGIHDFLFIKFYFFLYNDCWWKWIKVFLLHIKSSFKYDITKHVIIQDNAGDVLTLNTKQGSCWHNLIIKGCWETGDWWMFIIIGNGYGPVTLWCGMIRSLDMISNIL